MHASFVRPSHPLLFIPSLHVSVPQQAAHVLADDQRCLVGDQPYKHELWIIKDSTETGQLLLSIVFPLFSIHLSAFPTFLLSLCSCGCFELQKRCDMFRHVWQCERKRSRNTAASPWSQPQIVTCCLIKWMMTKHFISAQWVRYSIWGSESCLCWVEWRRQVGILS